MSTLPFFEKLKNLFVSSNSLNLRRSVYRVVDKILCDKKIVIGNVVDNINDLFDLFEKPGGLLSAIVFMVYKLMMLDKRFADSDKYKCETFAPFVRERTKYFAERFNKSRNVSEFEISALCAYCHRYTPKILNSTFLVMMAIDIDPSRESFLFLNDESKKWPFLIVVLYFLQNKNLIKKRDVTFLLRNYMLLLKNDFDNSISSRDGKHKKIMFVCKSINEAFEENFKKIISKEDQFSSLIATYKKFCKNGKFSPKQTEPKNRKSMEISEKYKQIKIKSDVEYDADILRVLDKLKPSFEKSIEDFIEISEKDKQIKIKSDIKYYGDISRVLDRLKTLNLKEYKINFCEGVTVYKDFILGLRKKEPDVVKEILSHDGFKLTCQYLVIEFLASSYLIIFTDKNRKWEIKFDFERKSITGNDGSCCIPKSALKEIMDIMEILLSSEMKDAIKRMSISCEKSLDDMNEIFKR